MLKEFYVDNFKSLVNITFHPGMENLLLGVNNAGKTNLCQALQFLAATTFLPVNECATRVVGVNLDLTNRYVNKSVIHFRVRAVLPWEAGEAAFQYELVLDASEQPQSPMTLAVREETLRVTGEGFNDVVLLENHEGNVQLLHESDFIKGRTNYVETRAPRETTMLNRLYQLDTNQRANRFKEYLASWRYFTLSAAALRSSAHNPNQQVLLPDGSNLSSVIYQLKTSNERDYRGLLKFLQFVEPLADLINFVVAPDNKGVYMFLEDSKGNRIPAPNISNGTLLFLALSYILTVPHGRPFYPLLMIEEPENGLHVKLLRDLVTLGCVSPYQPQLIFTTHSPYFIDLFDDKLDHVFVMKRAVGYSRLDSLDPQQVKKRLEEYPLGEQHFREMLT